MRGLCLFAVVYRMFSVNIFKTTGGAIRREREYRDTREWLRGERGQTLGGKGTCT